MAKTSQHNPDGLRCADLGNGTYLNPIIAGDHPDPTILKDGDDYYMSFSSFLAYPGIIIWHSRDLINWKPICTALQKNIGSVWALDLVKHEGRYYIYIPAVGDQYSSIYVIYADSIQGPWSDPIDLKLQCIDPGHAVGEDGKRYLFVNGIRRIALTDDGLSTVGELEQVYNPWRYPEDWVVEMFAPEGPKILRRGRYFYLISAVGGTAGPATSHMVIVARSESIHGPWIDCPNNPIIHTESDKEQWWSRGHASFVEGPQGDWWTVYHAYENGFRTLGRQPLLEPLRWNDDEWPEVCTGDLSLPLKAPVALEIPVSEYSLSDDFSHDRRGLQWNFYKPGMNEADRASYGDGYLEILGNGTSPSDSSPLTCINGDRIWEAEISLKPENQAVGGLILYYSERMYCGLSFGNGTMFTYHYGQEHSWMRQSLKFNTVRIRFHCAAQVLTMYYSLDDQAWQRHPWQMEVSGMNHNVFGGFTCLKIGLLSLGTGKVKFSHFTYKGENSL